MPTPIPRLPAAVVALAALAGAASAGAAPTLAPCRLPGLEHEVQCGVVKRALDPARPAGPQVDVHFAVIPALARNKKPDPVFFFAGGPGQSAMSLAGPIAASLARFANRRDVVLIDQRGTGRSAPLECDDDDPARPLAEQLDPQRQRARLRDCARALQAKPWGDLRFYTTTLAMEDADAVRAALGVERLNAVGVSYGTRAVLEYQRRFPQHVRRAVLDGVAPPDMVLPAAVSPDNQAALDALFASCAADAACARRFPDLRGRWQALLASLPRTATLRHPLTQRPETVTLTRELVVSALRGPLYAPVLASVLPQAIDDAADGRFDALAALGGALGGNKAMKSATGMHFSVVCAEDFPRLGRAPDTPGADFGTTFADLYATVCADWPKGSVPAAFYAVPPAPAAALLLSGAIDPVTPPRHAERTAKALGAKARHVVVPNAGHGTTSIGCVRDIVYRFVDAETDAEALRVDAACVQRFPRPPAFLPVEATP